jgi:uncharacterized phiE125 gp8 family phage protein
MNRSIAEVAPASEPLSLAEAKKQLEIPEADATHDSHVTRIISAARQQWERDTQRSTVSRTYVENLSDWPTVDWRFYHQPIVSVTSVKYYDTANSQQTLSSSVYSLDAPNRRLVLAVDQDWPLHETRWDAIEITYVAGQSSVDAIAKQGMLLLVDLYFELRLDTKEKQATERAYHNLMLSYCRGSYP